MFELIAKKGLIGYYRKEKDGKTYMIDFSKEPTSPIPVDNIPADVEYSVEYELISLKNEEIEAFGKELKEFITKRFTELLGKNNVNSVSEFVNIEKQICKDVYNLIDSKFSKVLVPSVIEYRSNIAEQSGISAVAKFSKPIPTVWEGINMQEDSVIVKELDKVYVGDGEVAEIIDYSNLSVPHFYITDIETTNKIEDILSEYFYIDANDIRGHKLGAIYFVGIRLRNISQDLEDLFERIREEERKKEREAFRKEKEKYVEENREKIEFVVKNYPRFFDNHLPDAYENMLKDIDSVLSYEFENIKKNIDKLYREVKLKYAYYSNPDTVIFRKDNFILTVADVLENRGFVELPKEYIGQFIGKGGKNIKELSKKLGIQLKVKEKGEEEKQKESIGYRPRI